jgi:transposase-like protein
VAVEKRGKSSGRVRRRVIPDFKAKTILPFLTQNVALGSTIYTDGLKSFEGLQTPVSSTSVALNRCDRNEAKVRNRR